MSKVSHINKHKIIFYDNFKVSAVVGEMVGRDIRGTNGTNQN